MGRKKLEIKYIQDAKNRAMCLNKRKAGLMKKAYELSVLCQCEIAFVVFADNGRLIQFASSDMDQLLMRYASFNEPLESRSNRDFARLLAEREAKGQHDDSDDEDGFPNASESLPQSGAQTQAASPVKQSHPPAQPNQPIQPMNIAPAPFSRSVQPYQLLMPSLTASTTYATLPSPSLFANQPFSPMTPNTGAFLGQQSVQFMQNQFLRYPTQSDQDLTLQPEIQSQPGKKVSNNNPAPETSVKRSKI